VSTCDATVITACRLLCKCRYGRQLCSRYGEDRTLLQQTKLSLLTHSLSHARSTMLVLSSQSINHRWTYYTRQMFSHREPKPSRRPILSLTSPQQHTVSYV